MHTFDHTVVNPDTPQHVTFHHYGLGRGGGDPQLKSLLELYKLSRAKDIIEVLKIDCEGCEYDSLSAPEVLDFLSTSVRQILIEVHWIRGPVDAAVERIVLLAERFRAAGFLTFSKEPNILARSGENIEYSLLNVRLPRSVI